MLSVKQGSIKCHFLSLWYDSTWDWISVSQAIGEHSTNLVNGAVLYIYIYIYIYIAFEILKRNHSIGGWEWQKIYSPPNHFTQPIPFNDPCIYMCVCLSLSLSVHIYIYVCVCVGFLKSLLFFFLFFARFNLQRKKKIMNALQKSQRKQNKVKQNWKPR